MSNQDKTISDTDAVTMQSHQDNFDASTIIPAGKLDADQYSADDLDGVTEGIFGSGNIAYASLQASQTDAAMALGDALQLNPGNISFESGTQGNAGYAPVSDSPFGSSNPNADSKTDTDRSLDSNDVQGSNHLGAEGNFTNTTVGSLGASTLSSDAGSFSSFSNSSSGGAAADISISNSTGEQTTVNNNGNNVTNNTSNNSNVINNTVSNNITIDSDDFNLGDTVDHITNIGGSVINNVIGGDIAGAINIISSEITEVTNILNTEINNIAETLTNVLQDTGITSLTDQVTSITNEATEIITDTVSTVINDVLGGPLTIELTSNSLDALGINFSAVLDNDISGQLDTNLITDNLLSLADELTGLSVPVSPDSGIEVSFDLLGENSIDDGNDILIAGVDTPNIDLAVVENITGDIDIQSELPTDLTEAETLLDNTGNIAESIDSLDIASPEAATDLIGDQGLDGALDVSAGDNSLIDQNFNTDADSFLNQSSDTVSDVTAETSEIINTTDISTEENLQDAVSGLDDALNVDSAIDLLSVSESVGIDTDNVTDTIADAGADEPVWTESIISDSSSTFGDVIGGLGGDADVLPEPTGTVAEGIGSLLVEPAPITHSSSLGGLF